MSYMYPTSTFNNPSIWPIDINIILAATLKQFRANPSHDVILPTNSYVCISNQYRVLKNITIVLLLLRIAWTIPQCYIIPQLGILHCLKNPSIVLKILPVEVEPLSPTERQVCTVGRGWHWSHVHVITGCTLDLSTPPEHKLQESRELASVCPLGH